MKTSKRISTPNGFTLVELLVVIAIIAVLAAAGFAGGNAAIQKARKVSAQAAASSVESAVESFYSDYSALPDVASQTDTSDPELLIILLGQETSDIQNDRKVRYLGVKEAKNGNRDGLVYTGNTVSGLYDPWGEPYYVVLDNEEGTEGYNEVLQFTPTGNSQVTLRGRRVAVYSLGTDTPADANSKTLVKTW